MGVEAERAELVSAGRDGEGWGSRLSRSARRVAAGVLSGLVAGLVIGGVGGRLAMFVLRRTSDASVVGLKTDDGFTIGRLSGDTLFLLIFTSGLGVLGGLFYLLVSSWFPQGLRTLLMGIFGGVLGGALFVRPGGIDFTRLSPLPLAIVLFIALPAAYGVLVSVLVERWLRDESRIQRSWVGLLGLIPLVFLSLGGLIGLLVVLVLLGAWFVGQAAPSSIALWHSAPITWIGRALLAGITGLALVDLIGKTAEIV